MRHAGSTTWGVFVWVVYCPANAEENQLLTNAITAWHGVSRTAVWAPWAGGARLGPSHGSAVRDQRVRRGRFAKRGSTEP
jgi:hypothetical protein